jgi:hypothetical protein
LFLPRKDGLEVLRERLGRDLTPEDLENLRIGHEQEG